jgi:integrase
MPHIVKKSKGWHVKWRECGQGSAVKTSPPMETKREAIAYMAKLAALESAKETTPDPCRPIPLAELVERHILTRPTHTPDQTARARYDQKDRQAFNRLLADHPRWRLASDITRTDYQALTFSRRRLAKTILKLARAHNQATDQTILHLRPPTRPRAPKPDLLTPQQIAQIQEKADTWGPGTGLTIHLLATYGHRPESIATLPQSAYNPATQTLTLQIKGGDTHRHPILPATAHRIQTTQKHLTTILKRPLTPLDPLCPTHYNTPGHYWPKGESIAWWYRKAIGQQIHPQTPGIYQLKRQAITRLLSNLKNDSRTVASITGHRTPSLLLDTYAQTNEERQRTAIATLL